MNEARKEPLQAELLMRDERVLQAKKLLLSALEDHQAKITGIKPADSDRIESYEKTLAEFAKCRGAKLYYPYIGSGIGKGALVELLDGSIKYDFITGIGVHFLGHSHPLLTDAMIDAALSDTVMEGHLQQNADAFELSRLLIQCSKMDHCFLSSSGAMANENAIKLAFQKNFPANRLLAFDRCFMGRTLALSQVTDKPSFRVGLPPTLLVDYIPFYDPNRPEESTNAAVAALKRYIARYPKQHALFAVELVQGEGGAHAGTREFFLELLTVARDNNIIIFFDEVQTFGRTLELFAYQAFNLENFADIVSVGKMSQACATLFKKEIVPGPGLLSQTFTSSTSAIRASIAIIKHLLQDGYYGPTGKNAMIQDRFSKLFQDIERRHPGLITGPYGIGAMVVFTAFGGDAEKTTKFAQKLFAAGVIGFTAGSNPTRMRFLIPSGAISIDEIDPIVSIIEKTLLDSF